MDLNNFPADWVNGDRIKIVFRVDYVKNILTYPTTSVIELMLNSTTNVSMGVMLHFQSSSSWSKISTLDKVSNWNDGKSDLLSLNFSNSAVGVTRSNISNYVYKMWRLKK